MAEDTEETQEEKPKDTFTKSSQYQLIYANHFSASEFPDSFRIIVARRETKEIDIFENRARGSYRTKIAAEIVTSKMAAESLYKSLEPYFKPKEKDEKESKGEKKDD